MNTKKIILITGCGSGIGMDSAISLAMRGHRVIATTRTDDSARKLLEISKKNNFDLESFKLDITDEKDRQKILQYDIDVLINNAGVGESGSLTEIPLDKIRSDFEVNIFGSLALTQLALQIFIPRDFGTILFVSSLAGRIPMTFLGSYSMSKFALSGGADVLHHELRDISKNIHVSVIEPGGYHTGFNQKNSAKKYVWMNEDSYFYELIDKLKRDEIRYFNRYEIKSTKSIVKQIVKACEDKNPKFRYTAPWWQSLGIQIQRIFGR